MRALIAAFLLLFCGISDIRAQEVSITDVALATRESLLSRLRLRDQCAPGMTERSMIGPSGDTGRVSLASIAQGLIEAYGGREFSYLAGEGDEWRASNDAFTAVWNQEGSNFSVAFLGEPVVAEVQVQDNDWITEARELAARFGVSVTELDDGVVRGLGRAAPGDPAGRGKRIATTVFFGRRINGTPVIGEKLSMTFYARGKLAGISGRWSPVDFTRARLGCAATPQEITEIAVSILMPRALSLAPASEINVRFAYFPERDSDGVGVIDLRGVVDVAVQGPSGGRAREIYDFAL